jgi:hypothetical protein
MPGARLFDRSRYCAAQEERLHGVVNQSLTFEPKSKNTGNKAATAIISTASPNPMTH